MLKLAGSDEGLRTYTAHEMYVGFNVVGGQWQEIAPGEFIPVADDGSACPVLEKTIEEKRAAEAWWLGGAQDPDPYDGDLEVSETAEPSAPAVPTPEAA